MRLTGVRWWIGLVVLVVLGACGSDDPGVTTQATGSWVRHDLGPFAADREILAVPTDRGVAGLTVEDGNAVRAFTLDADGALATPTVTATPGTTEFRTISAMTLGPRGLVAIGADWYPEWQNVVYVADDAGSWTEVATVGLETPMDVLDLRATQTGYVAVGALRTAADPRNGPFEPTILTSPDGIEWTSASLPATGEGFVHAVVEAESGLLAVGSVDDAVVAWRSTDGGASWSDAPGVPAVDQLARHGDTVMAARASPDGERPLALHRSDDGGETWQALDTAFADDLGYVVLSADEHGFALSGTAAFLDVWSAPERCYVDMDRCGARNDAENDELFVSDDGESWRRVDLAALDGLFQVGSVAHGPDGDTVVAGADEDGAWSAWVWDAANGDVPERQPDPEPPAYDGPPIVEWDGELAVGTRYAYPLYIHCGTGYLARFNGVHWGRVDRPPDDAIGDDWPVVAQSILGYVELIADDRIEYSLADGEVIAVYEPIPDSAVPGCD